MTVRGPHESSETLETVRLPRGLVVTLSVPRTEAVDAVLAALDRGEIPAEAILVKANSVRSVHRLDLASVGEIYLKRDRPRKLLERLRYLVRTPRGLAEARALRAVRGLGLPAPEPVFWGARRRGGLVHETVLAMRSLGTAQAVGYALDASPHGSPERARWVGFVIETGRLLRVLHEAGFAHRDLHLANVVVVERCGALAGPYLIDLQKLVRLGRVPWGARMRDLARLALQLTANERRELVCAYLPDASAARRRKIYQWTWRRAERWWRLHRTSRAKRCLKRSSGFRVEDDRGARLYRRADVPAAALQAAIALHWQAVEALTEGCASGAAAAGAAAAGTALCEGVVAVKIDRHSRVTKQSLLLPGGGDDGAGGDGAGVEGEASVAAAVAVKSFPQRGGLRSLLHVVSPHRGLLAWRGAHRLRCFGIPSPRPLGLLEARRFGVVTHSTVVTVWPQGSMALPDLVRERFGGNGVPVRDPLPFAEECWLVRVLGGLLARLHRERIYHRDLKPPNVLWVPTDPAARGVKSSNTAAPDPASPLQILDCDAVGGRLTPRRRVKNLAQLEDFVQAFLPEVKRTHRLRFLRAYERTLCRAIDRRKLVRSVREAVRVRAAARAERRAESPPRHRE